ncbi:MAG: arsenite S-adenosylmethyltransferase, partial [Planctomycetaceae bacterium]|nr:arsenite S-adenosylmethyltransferase [Planctomycetaceae bacterium]
DEDVSDDLKSDPTLWSGCLSGAYREDQFLEAFEAAGFHGIEILNRQTEPWNTVRGIEFRSLTVQVFKGKAGPCLERHQAVIYTGPWKAVIDDDGHTLERGKRMAVCDKTFQIYSREPYASDITPIPPRQEVPLATAKLMSCLGTPLRDPRQTKSQMPALSLLPISDCCGTTDCC